MEKDDKKKKVIEIEEEVVVIEPFQKLKVLKKLTADKVYLPGENISLNNKKQINFLKTNKYIK